jgi:hypothetical protein
MKAMAKHRSHSIEFKRQVAQGFIAGEREGGEQARHPMIEDGQVLPAGLLAESAGEPAFDDAKRASDQQIEPRPDLVVGGEIEEQPSMEPRAAPKSISSTLA